MGNIVTTETLLTAAVLGDMLNLSKRQIFRLNSGGKIPASVRIGGTVRWSEYTISKWLAAGAPNRRIFEAMQVGKLELFSAADVSAMCQISRRSEKLKEQLGELLLYPQSSWTKEQQKSYWRIFEQKLREYLALKYPRR